jgi:hypothetical protein
MAIFRYSHRILREIVSSIDNCGVAFKILVLESFIVGTSQNYLKGHGYHHTVRVETPLFETKYYYSCGGDRVMSEVTSFISSPDISSSKTISLAIFGDMGYEDSISRPSGILGLYEEMHSMWSRFFVSLKLFLITIVFIIMYFRRRQNIEFELVSDIFKKFTR